MLWAKTQKGETLVEVALAVAGLSLVMALAYSLVTRSISDSQAAKERSQAAAFVQHQFEALRNYRDNRSWSDFKTAVGCNPNCSGTFHLVRSGGIWSVGNGSTSTFNGQSTIYTIAITPSVLSTDKLRFDIAAQWTGISNIGTQNIAVTTFLVNIDGITPR